MTASDYASIRLDNERGYGTRVGRYGKRLLAGLYDDRTHFIFELLQNSEDALARRSHWKGTHSIRFHLTMTGLRVSHFGQPFNEADVRAICGIDESTKDELTAIGRFGIGFKSVYAFTERPEIHSGKENFAIESFVLPTAAPPIDRESEETVILVPLKASEDGAREEIVAGLERLEPSALLFLRQIDEIRWSVEGGRSGLYGRHTTEIDPAVRRVTLVGREGGSEIDESWLVFSRPLMTDGGCEAGHAEIAFHLAQDRQSGKERVERLEHSSLVVFFPTIVETHLGFLIQGPYRTTPSRDNVPRGDTWNQRLVSETGDLLVDALRWMRDHDLLTAGTIRCLPLDVGKFGEGTRFMPLFAATKEALRTEALLPRFAGGHMPATQALLARTQELRELFSPPQLSALFKKDAEVYWVSGDITHDRTPELQRYLMQELDVPEITPDTIVTRLDKEFLEAQPDEWIIQLYHFLNGQQGLRRRLEDVPLIRLEEGNHVAARLKGQLQAFLPGTIKSGFPTVRASVCGSETARKFLGSLGLTEPDPVDDVVRNVMPKYSAGGADISETNYAGDIDRIVTAFATDSKVQRDKLIRVLENTPFVMATDGADKSKQRAKPGEVYLPTEGLKGLFAGLGGVMFVDETYPCLRGENVQELLQACGAAGHFRPVPDPSLSQSPKELKELRIRGGHPETSHYSDRVTDWTLSGLDALLAELPCLAVEDRRSRAELLWQELALLEERRGNKVFAAQYTWTHNGKYQASCDAAFVRKLSATAWVPDAQGELQRPEFVLFEPLAWKANPFLQSRIPFKPPIIEALAREAGIEPSVLDLLKQHGVTSEAGVRALLGLKADAPSRASKQHAGDTAHPSAPDAEIATNNGESGRSHAATDAGGATRDADGQPETVATQDGERMPASVQGRQFVSYVGVHSKEEVDDPDGLDHEARMALEEKAVSFILALEPGLQRTPTHNPGFDLFEASESGVPVRWIEVKAMSRSLSDRPVGLTHTQFECAREHGKAYWLYVVEHAGDEGAVRTVRIQDPAGKARTFTFDKGWLATAELGHCTS